MNIGYFSHYFTPEIGAPSARIYDLAQQWIRHGHEVEVVTCFPNHPTGEVYPGYELGRYMGEVLDGISVHRNWSYVTPNKGFLKKSLGHFSFWPSARFNSEKHLGSIDVAIGSSPTFFAAMAAQGSARRRQIPFVMEVRDLWPAIFTELGVLENRQVIALLEKWEMWMYGRATKIVTVTETFRQRLIERGVPPSNVHTVLNGADINFWQPVAPPEELRRRLHLQESFVVLYIGAHGISQALSSVVQSAALLRERKEIQFLFVGDGAEKEMLEAQVAQKGLDNVQFLDPVTKVEVREFYTLADVCLVPLRDIPLFSSFIPSKMFEMLAMGRPIIGSLRGEAADILCRSGGAVVVPPEDSQALAEAISIMYADRERALEMGKEGQRFVRAHYSRARLAETYAAILKEAVDEHKYRA